MYVTLSEKPYMSRRCSKLFPYLNTYGVILFIPRQGVDLVRDHDRETLVGKGAKDFGPQIVSKQEQGISKQKKSYNMFTLKRAASGNSDRRKGIVLSKL